jgi:hypothetical protein
LKELCRRPHDDYLLRLILHKAEQQGNFLLFCALVGVLGTGILTPSQRRWLSQSLGTQKDTQKIQPVMQRLLRGSLADESLRSFLWQKAWNDEDFTGNQEKTH